MAHCIYVQIKDLTLSSHSFFINALIIAKTEKRIIHSQLYGKIVGVITYTLRDTKDHFINCTVWGSEAFIEKCDRTYKIGHVIAVYNPSVQQQNESSQYRPKTTSPFELIVNESKASIHREHQESSHLLELRNQKFKPTALALNMADLHTNPDGERVDVDLVAMGKSVRTAVVNRELLV